MKIKYLKGWISVNTINIDGWVTEWAKSAEEAESKNRQLVVFEIPKSGDLISAIEKFLQENVS